MLVTPSILTGSPEDVISQVQRLTPYFKTFQIDIADGLFVPNTTISVPQLDEYIRHHHLRETFSELTIDFHLMVQDYMSNLEYLEHLSKQINVGVILIHAKLRPSLSELKSLFPRFTIGLVLNPEETVQDFSSYYTLSEVPLVQIMSVDPGFQGSPFIPDMLNKIDQLKNADYRFKIYLDGGINKETLPVIISRRFPPDVIGPGSYLSKADDIEARVRELNSLIEQPER